MINCRGTLPLSMIIPGYSCSNYDCKTLKYLAIILHKSQLQAPDMLQLALMIWTLISDQHINWYDYYIFETSSEHFTMNFKELTTYTDFKVVILMNY